MTPRSSLRAAPGKADPGRNGDAGTAAGHVLVVGAGIVGVATALWLQRAGKTVTLVDRSEPGSAASFGNAGAFATYASMPVGSPQVIRGLPGMLFDPTGPLAIRWGYLPRLAGWLARFIRHSTPAEVERLSIAIQSLLDRSDADYAPLLADISRTDFIRRNGCLYLYATASDHAAAAPEIAIKRRRGVVVDELGPDDVRQMEPAIAPVYSRALFFPDASHTIDPQALTLALFDLFLQRGGVFHKAPVDRLEVIDGMARHAVTASGPIAADQFVITAGAWSKSLFAPLGDRIPLDTERGYHVMFPRTDTVSRPVGWARGGFYLTPMAAGLRVAGTVELGGLERPADPRRISRLAEGARHLIPDLPEPASNWLGFRPSMPDSLPVIGRSPSVSNVIHAFGHGHLGLTMAGATGRIVSEIASGRQSAVDITPFSPQRFRRGRQLLASRL